MKKLNRKGFTLIELLAIIVILAIIMVVTIPTVLSSMGNARETTFQNSANTIPDWIEKEYTMAQIGNADAAFTDVCGVTGSGCVGTAKTVGTNEPGAQTTRAVITDTNAKAMLKAAGVSEKNYSYVSILITNGRACIVLNAATGGDFDSLAKDASKYTKSSTAC